MAWALEQTGLIGKYGDAVEELIDQTRMYTYEKPDSMPADQRLVTLALPDTEAFETHDWVLFAHQIDAGKLTSLVGDAIGLITQAMGEQDGLERLGESVTGLLDSLHLDMSELESPVLAMDEDAGDDGLSKIFQRLLAWSGDRVSVQSLASWEELDTHTIPLIVDADKPTVYMLLKVSHGGAQVDNVVLKLGDTWYDMGGFATPYGAGGAGKPDRAEVESMSWSIAEELVANLSVIYDTTDEGDGGTSSASKAEELPTAGLEKVRANADAAVEATTEKPADMA